MPCSLAPLFSFRYWYFFAAYLWGHWYFAIFHYIFGFLPFFSFSLSIIFCLLFLLMISISLLFSDGFYFAFRYFLWLSLDAADLLRHYCHAAAFRRWFSFLIFLSRFLPFHFRHIFWFLLFAAILLFFIDWCISFSYHFHSLWYWLLLWCFHFHYFIFFLHFHIADISLIIFSLPDAGDFLAFMLSSFFFMPRYWFYLFHVLMPPFSLFFRLLISFRCCRYAACCRAAMICPLLTRYFSRCAPCCLWAVAPLPRRYAAAFSAMLMTMPWLRRLRDAARFRHWYLLMLRIFASLMPLADADISPLDYFLSPLFAFITLRWWFSLSLISLLSIDLLLSPFRRDFFAISDTIFFAIAYFDYFDALLMLSSLPCQLFIRHISDAYLFSFLRLISPIAAFAALRCCLIFRYCRWFHIDFLIFFAFISFAADASMLLMPPFAIIADFDFAAYFQYFFSFAQLFLLIFRFHAAIMLLIAADAAFIAAMITYWFSCDGHDAGCCHFHCLVAFFRRFIDISLILLPFLPLSLFFSFFISLLMTAAEALLSCRWWLPLLFDCRFRHFAFLSLPPISFSPCRWYFSLLLAFSFHYFAADFFFDFFIFISSRQLRDPSLILPVIDAAILLILSILLSCRRFSLFDFHRYCLFLHFIFWFLRYFAFDGCFCRRYWCFLSFCFAADASCPLITQAWRWWFSSPWLIFRYAFISLAIIFTPLIIADCHFSLLFWFSLFCQITLICWCQYFRHFRFSLTLILLLYWLLMAYLLCWIDGYFLRYWYRRFYGLLLFFIYFLISFSSRLRGFLHAIVAICFAWWWEIHVTSCLPLHMPHTTPDYAFSIFFSLFLLWCFSMLMFRALLRFHSARAFHAAYVFFFFFFAAAARRFHASMPSLMLRHAFRARWRYAMLIWRARDSAPAVMPCWFWWWCHYFRAIGCCYAADADRFSRPPRAIFRDAMPPRAGAATRADYAMPCIFDALPPDTRHALTRARRWCCCCAVLILF